MAKKFYKKNWIISRLRRLSLKYPPAIAARNRTKQVYYIQSKKDTPMKRVKYSCEKCLKTDLKSTETELDHIVPVVPLTGWDDWNGFVERLYCDEEGFQLLCLFCHTEKSQIEDAQRVNLNITPEKAIEIVNNIGKKLKKKRALTKARKMLK